MSLNIKYLLLGVVFALTACNQPPPVQSSVYQETVQAPVSVDKPMEQYDGDINASDVALGVATGVVVGAVAKSAYDKRKASKKSRKQVVVVNKYYSKPVRSYTKQSNRSKRK